MLEEEKRNYKETYNQLVSLFAELHNAHVNFYDSPSERTGFTLRRAVRNIRAKGKELSDISQSYYKELRIVAKARVKARKEKEQQRKNKNG